MHRSSHDLTPVLEKLQLRSTLKPAECEAFLALPYRTMHLARGKFLVQEGEHVSACSALLSGYACSHKQTRSGHRQIISVHLKGDLVDLYGSAFATSDESLQTLSGATLALIPREAIAGLALRHPGLARALWLDASIKAAIAHEWLLNVGRRNARQRISHLFCELVLRGREVGLDERKGISVPFTQEQIGDAIGLTPVHVNRTLQGMRADGLIRFDGGTLEVIDWHALTRAGDFDEAYLHQPFRVAA